MKKTILIISFISFIFLGLEFNYLFMLFALCTMALALIYYNQIKINKKNLFILLLWMVYFIVLYIIGNSRLTNNEPITYTRFIFTIIYILFISSYFKKGELLYLLKTFCLFTWLAQSIIIIHSYYLDPSYYGRGRLFFYQTNEIINSPIIGILLSVSLGLFILIEKNTRIIVKIALITLSIIMLLYIGSRTGLIILILSLLISIKQNTITHKKIFPLIFILSISSLLGIFFIDSYLDDIFIFTEKISQRGIDSPRYLMWEQGIKSIFDYPFGGMSFSVPGYQGIWFHNILLDTARTSGIIPLFILIFLISFYLINPIINKNKNIFIINLILVLPLMSDVIIEGGGAIRLIFLLILYNSIVYIKENGKSDN